MAEDAPEKEVKSNGHAPEEPSAVLCVHENAANNCPVCETMDYESAMHGIQAGVALEIAHELPGIPENILRHLKHVRVGINSAHLSENALARLLIDKGIIDEAEYVESQRVAANRELIRYEAHLAARYGGGSKFRLR